MKSFQLESNRSEGFSLIELMIVLVIVGIIVAVGYPQYTDYLIKSGRSEGVAALVQLMERQEKHYRDELTYTTDLTDLGYPGNAIESETGRYQLTAGGCADAGIRRCVLLTAAPQNKQATDPTGNLTLNSRGAKSVNWPM